MELRDRIVLVTGAAQRVGGAIAVRLAGAGMHVAVHFRRSAAEAARTVTACAAQGVRAEAFAADLADVAAPARLVAAALERFGRLDVLVNSAAVFTPMTLAQFSPAAWEDTLRVNLMAPLALAHAAWPALRAARGRIVNLSDALAGKPWPGHLAYGVSKAALDALTVTLARALAPEVNVVGVAPGVAAWPDEYDQELRDRLTARIPLGRPGTPEDIAAAVEFLLRDGDYITGVTLPVDAGYGVM